MFEIIAIAVVVAIAAILIYAATKPDTFRIQRAATIQATPEAIFPLINDLHAWSAWSPWEKKDPGMKRNFSTDAVGKGASYAWEGNKDVGQGRMEIAESSPPSRIEIRLDFIKPFDAHNIVEFHLEPQGDATRVTWSMHGPSPYLSKLMCIFFNMDKMCGKDFEAGLADLKAAAER